MPEPQTPYATPAPKDREEDLVTRAMGGDDDAFSKLVSRNRNRVFRFLAQHAVSPAEAEELAQEVFASAHKSMGKFEGKAKFSTWLTGIALNIVRNFINRNPERKIERSIDDLTHPSAVMTARADSQATPSRQTEHKMRVEHLSRAIEELSPDLRDTFVLVVLEDLDYDSAATRLGVPVGTVKSRVSRARARLKELMDEYSRPSVRAVSK
jgi:RNA polymerase sigma-70 factor, ECF subfamily